MARDIFLLSYFINNCMRIFTKLLCMLQYAEEMNGKTRLSGKFCIEIGKRERRGPTMGKPRD